MCECNKCEYWNLRYQVDRYGKKKNLIQWWTGSDRDRNARLDDAINQLKKWA